MKLDVKQSVLDLSLSDMARNMINSVILKQDE